MQQTVLWLTTFPQGIHEVINVWNVAPSIYLNSPINVSFSAIFDCHAYICCLKFFLVTSLKLRCEYDLKSA